MTHGEFLTSLFHDGREAVRDYTRSYTPVVYNSEESTEGIPVVSLSSSKADMFEERWYRENKDYSQRVPSVEYSQLPGE